MLIDNPKDFGLRLGLANPVAPSPATSVPGGTDRRVRLFGIELFDTNLEDAAQWIVMRASLALPTSIGFLNAHCVNVMRTNGDYRVALNGVDRIFADGMGLRIAARAAGVVLQDNVNGTDLFPILCRHAARKGVGMYLFGAREGIAAAAAQRMIEDNPDLIVSGTHHGFVADPDAETRLIAEINSSGARILLVGLGVPAQELWIARNRSRLQPAVIIGVGGLFDYYSGRIARAPLRLRKAGLEWAWRLALEPRRLAKRYLLGNATFLTGLMRDLLVAPADFTQPSVR
jgi:exopolysaccharide biosynthesis WecB/TagA/CpsF family protein